MKRPERKYKKVTCRYGYHRDTDIKSDNVGNIDNFVKPDEDKNDLILEAHLKCVELFHLKKEFVKRDIAF